MKKIFAIMAAVAALCSCVEKSDPETPSIHFVNTVEPEVYTYTDVMVDAFSVPDMSSSSHYKFEVTEFNSEATLTPNYEFTAKSDDDSVTFSFYFDNLELKRDYSVDGNVEEGYFFDNATLLIHGYIGGAAVHKEITNIKPGSTDYMAYTNMTRDYEWDTYTRTYFREDKYLELSFASYGKVYAFKLYSTTTTVTTVSK